MTWMKLATYALGAALIIAAYLVPGLLVGAGHDALVGIGVGLVGLNTPHPLDKTP